jgi:hypothetical protein
LVMTGRVGISATLNGSTLIPAKRRA